MTQTLVRSAVRVGDGEPFLRIPRFPDDVLPWVSPSGVRRTDSDALKMPAGVVLSTDDVDVEALACANVVTLLADPGLDDNRVWAGQTIRHMVRASSRGDCE